MREMAASIAVTLALAWCALTANADSALGWPRATTTAAGARITLSSLQVDEWRDCTLFAKCVATVQLNAQAPPFIGTTTLRATTLLDRGDRMVVLSDITLPAMRFLTDAQGIVPIGNALTTAFAGATLRVPLDDLLATMSATAFAAATAQSDAAPPFEVRLAALLAAQPAQFTAIVAERLDGCTNSNALLFRTDAGVFYLLIAGHWYTSDALQDGAWQWVAPSTLPSAMREISESSQWASALAHIPQTPLWREAVQIAAFSPPLAIPEPLASDQLRIWWNPWDGSWWPAQESAPARATRTAPSSPSAPDSFRFDAASENLFVGLDGRVYAQRGAGWFRNTAEGGWIELTEQRSTARVLEDFARARRAATARRTSYEKWRTAQSATDLSLPTTASQERLSMQSARPSSVGMRQTKPVAP